MNTAYTKLQNRFRQISRLENAQAILGWDEAVVMPPGSGDSRNDSLVELAAVIQNLSLSPEIGEWLQTAMEDKSIDPWAHANLREMKRKYLENTTIPVELNQKLVRARMEGEQRWRELRKANDWAAFLPYQREVLNLSREALGFLSAQSGLAPYNTALNQYSPGLTEDVVNNLFDSIKSFLPKLIHEASERGKKHPPIQPRGKFPMAAQKALGAELMATLGFSFAHGRLDESHHPFCGGTPRDVRITTRYDENDFLSALMGVLHETGHALYEQHLPLDYAGQPVGLAAGMAIHESQSLFFEMQVCRSPDFLAFAAPHIKKHLGPSCENPESLAPENLARLVTLVEPGFIRVDADEVTYPAHVILRFELERDLIGGKLDIGDLPAAWNEKMVNYLGLSTLGRDDNGCMQDVHWPAGSFGYFPAYTFGAVIAAHLFKRLRNDEPTIGESIRGGDFTLVRGWLNEKIWSKGSLRPTLDLVQDAAGPLTVEAYKLHLERRYQVPK